MQKPTYKELLDAGCHFGHLRKKWNPKMTPYIFMEHKGIHIIDLNRTAECLERAAQAMKAMAKSGKKIMFVATKKQARDIVQKAAESVGMPFVTERWLGGMMTNFMTIRKSVKKMNNIERMLADTTLTSITKKERLTLSREHAKMNKQLGGIANLNRLPSPCLSWIFTTNTWPWPKPANWASKPSVWWIPTPTRPWSTSPIPSNDDASKAIAFITNYLAEAIREGLEERKAMKARKRRQKRKV
jgi:small subunit ribosomal protein S2